MQWVAGGEYSYEFDTPSAGTYKITLVVYDCNEVEKKLF
jgi:hypothetical protein